MVKTSRTLVQGLVLTEVEVNKKALTASAYSINYVKTNNTLNLKTVISAANIRISDWNCITVF